jgi:peptidoglycan/xylan/chitin deacetylase (PgdA/CDA1 family)
VTLFITGEILDRYPELIEPYQQEKEFFQFELHAYNHNDVYNSIESKIKNLQNGIIAYTKYFGHKPKIYRAPDGVISFKEIALLTKNNILFGSNFFPTLFPGRFNNAHIPRSSFKIQEFDFYEMPISVTRFFRIPIALSYMQLIGFKKFLCLLKIENLADIIYDFHLHDLFPEEAFKKKNFSILHKIAYLKTSRKGKAFCTFQKFVEFGKKNGYEFCLMNTLALKLKDSETITIGVNEVFKV